MRFTIPLTRPEAIAAINEMGRAHLEDPAFGPERLSTDTRVPGVLWGEDPSRESAFAPEEAATALETGTTFQWETTSGNRLTIAKNAEGALEATYAGRRHALFANNGASLALEKAAGASAAGKDLGDWLSAKPMTEVASYSKAAPWEPGQSVPPEYMGLLSDDPVVVANTLYDLGDDPVHDQQALNAALLDHPTDDLIVGAALWPREGERTPRIMPSPGVFREVLEALKVPDFRLRSGAVTHSYGQKETYSEIREYLDAFGGNSHLEVADGAREPLVEPVPKVVHLARVFEAIFDSIPETLAERYETRWKANDLEFISPLAP